MYDLHDLLYNVQFQCSNLYSLEIKLMPAVGYCVSMYFYLVDVCLLHARVFLCT
jgi:hypothetical protein